MAEVFPDEWLVPEALPWVINLLRRLPMNPKMKKRALQEWADLVGVKLTAKDIEAVTGLPAGEI